MAGLVLLGLNESIACAIATRILGQTFTELTELAETGIAELANVIVGRATTLLAAAGYQSNIAPPALIIGRGARISTVIHQPFIIPLLTSLGVVDLQVALKSRHDRGG